MTERRTPRLAREAAATRPALLISMTKRPDGGSVLSCTRADGTVTWQRHQGRQGHFFPLHDLTHFAVETTLGFRRAFFGLIAEGWDVEDTTGKGPRGPLPDEALFVERLVGLISLGRGGEGPWTAEELNDQLAAGSTRTDGAAAVRLSEERLDRVLASLTELVASWALVEPGSTMTLSFEPGAPP